MVCWMASSRSFLVGVDIDALLSSSGVRPGASCDLRHMTSLAGKVRCVRSASGRRAGRGAGVVSAAGGVLSFRTVVWEESFMAQDNGVGS